MALRPGRSGGVCCPAAGPAGGVLMRRRRPGLVGRPQRSRRCRDRSVPRLEHAAREGIGVPPVFDPFMFDNPITTSRTSTGPVGDLWLIPLMSAIPPRPRGMRGRRRPCAGSRADRRQRRGHVPRRPREPLPARPRRGLTGIERRVCYRSRRSGRNAAPERIEAFRVVLFMGVRGRSREGLGVPSVVGTRPSGPSPGAGPGAGATGSARRRGARRCRG